MQECRPWEIVSAACKTVLMQESSAPPLDRLISQVAQLCSVTSDFDKMTQLEKLQQLANAAYGAIARVSVDFDHSQREQQRLSAVPSRERGRGVADQIALAPSHHTLAGFARPRVRARSEHRPSRHGRPPEPWPHQ